MKQLQPSKSNYGAQEPTLMMAWLPAAIGVLVICLESTKTMSAAHTGQWLLAVCHWLWGQAASPTLETVNFVLRKLGHFCGYGTLALLFRRGWYYTLLQPGSRRLLFSSAALGVICTFGVACADELHQSFLPGRTSSFHDVLIDTSGAIVFHVVFGIFLSRRAPVEDSVPLGV
jgi:VanZ family protein